MWSNDVITNIFLILWYWEKIRGTVLLFLSVQNKNNIKSCQDFPLSVLPLMLEKGLEKKNRKQRSLCWYLNSVCFLLFSRIIRRGLPKSPQPLTLFFHCIQRYFSNSFPVFKSSFGSLKWMLWEYIWALCSCCFQLMRTLGLLKMHFLWPWEKFP